jgi:hypothetical protein
VRCGETAYRSLEEEVVRVIGWVMRGSFGSDEYRLSIRGVLVEMDASLDPDSVVCDCSPRIEFAKGDRAQPEIPIEVELEILRKAWGLCDFVPGEYEEVNVLRVSTKINQLRSAYRESLK